MRFLRAHIEIYSQIFAILFQKGARVQNSEIFGTHLKCEIVKQDKCPKYAGFEISGRPLAICE
jgi:hypothetical protein